MALDFGDTEPPVEVRVNRDPEFYYALIRDLSDVGVSFNELERQGYANEFQSDRAQNLWVAARGQVDKDLLRVTAEAELGRVAEASNETRNLCDHNPVHLFNEACESDGFARFILDGHAPTCQTRDAADVYRHPVTACGEPRKLCLDDPPHTYGQACGDYHEPAR